MKNGLSRGRVFLTQGLNSALLTGLKFQPWLQYKNLIKSNAQFRHYMAKFSTRKLKLMFPVPTCSLFSYIVFLILDVNAVIGTVYIDICS